jgi:DNA damage-inducible protein 1
LHHEQATFTSLQFNPIQFDSFFNNKLIVVPHIPLFRTKMTTVTPEITIIYGDNVYPFPYDSSQQIHSLKATLAQFLTLPANQQTILFQNKTLSDNTTLNAAGVKAGDVLELRKISATSSATTNSSATNNLNSHRPTLENIPSELLNNPPALQQYLRDTPELMNELIRLNPTLAEAVWADSPEFFTQVLQQMTAQRRDTEVREQQRISQLNKDPFDAEAQRQIEDQIRLQNIQQNMEMAVEYTPEAFARVTMLYIPMVVNGHSLAAFIDSGAQSTIMSKQCAERCGILRLMDVRFAGMAKGVGTAKILGRVHAVKVQIGKSFFISSFTILDNDSMDFLFGLDQLKKHQASIDLKDNVLRIGEEAIQFMHEKDLPAHAKDGFEDEKANNNTANNNNKPITSTSPPTTTNNTNRSPVQPPQSTRPTTTTTSIPANSRLLQPQNPSTSSSPAASAAARRDSSQMSVDSRPGFSEEKLKKITDLGFSRQEAIQALSLCQGNEEAAASYLFGQQMGF